MSDVFGKKKRSWIMSRISGVDTIPEIVVRKIIHGKGFRFLLHVRELPGNPDIALPRHKKAVFVHGCFWHGHQGCRRSNRPTTNKKFWNKKIEGNIERDEKARRDLRKMGWKILVVWECKTKNRVLLDKRLSRFLYN